MRQVLGVSLERELFMRDYRKYRGWLAESWIIRRWVRRGACILGRQIRVYGVEWDVILWWKGTCFAIEVRSRHRDVEYAVQKIFPGRKKYRLAHGSRALESYIGRHFPSLMFHSVRCLLVVYVKKGYGCRMRSYEMVDGGIDSRQSR